MRPATGPDLTAGQLVNADAGECLDRIAEAARRQAVAVMCFEADEHRCHRDLVLEAVRERFSRAVPACVSYAGISGRRSRLSGVLVEQAAEAF
ncbi:DUF488 family protein [Streptosporangium sp. NPDC002607]